MNMPAQEPQVGQTVFYVEQFLIGGRCRQRWRTTSIRSGLECRRRTVVPASIGPPDDEHGRNVEAQGCHQHARHDLSQFGMQMRASAQCALH